MAEVYLVCAPETENELFRFMQGQADCPLSPRGRRQLCAVDTFFMNVQPDRVYSGTGQSAVAVAERIAVRYGMSCETTAELNEIGLGVWEGCAAGNLAYDQPEAYRRFVNEPYRWGVDGCEEAERAADRIMRAFHEITASGEDKTIVLISHKYILRLLIGDLSGVPRDEMNRVPLPENGSVTRLTTSSEGIAFITMNDTAHLLEQDREEGVREYKEPQFDATLYYQWIRAAEYGDLFADAVESVWCEAGMTVPFHRFDVMDDASRYETVVAFAEQIPAGFLQYGTVDGTIRLLFSHPAAREAGIGTQLVGKAVVDGRERGWDSLSIILPAGNPYKHFFETLGFELVETEEDGSARYLKKI